jgi:hypothetical protein
MQENIYAAPESSLLATEAAADNHEFYVVSKKKFLALYFLTFSFYATYWHYKNWYQYKLKNNETLMPIMRGIFSIFFTHVLFSIVDMRLKDKGSALVWNPTLLAVVVVGSAIGGNIADRFSDKEIGTPFTYYITLILLILRGFGLLNAQLAINESCGDPLGESNSRFTLWNYLWAVTGGMLLLLAVIGFVVVE